MASIEYADVHGIAPDVQIDYQDYWRSERDVITPALTAAGYQVGPWYTAEGDSFGPLCRAARATTPDGRPVIVCYG